MLNAEFNANLSRRLILISIVVVLLIIFLFSLSLYRYVYCYKCILKTTESEGKCPVTNYQITMDDLIRIYEN